MGEGLRLEERVEVRREGRDKGRYSAEMRREVRQRRCERREVRPQRCKVRRYFINVGEERIELRHYRVEVWCEVRQLVEKFIAGADAAWVDYGAIDGDETLDDGAEREQDREDAYFESDY